MNEAEPTLPTPTPTPTPSAEPPGGPLHFRTRHRLTHAREFEAVYDARMRKSRGPLIVFTRPNGLPNHRLGLAVSARLGGAVLRNRLKRLIREAFRHEQHTLPRAPSPESDAGHGFDIIVSVRGREPLPLAAYRTLLVQLVADAAAEWSRRGRRADSENPP